MNKRLAPLSSPRLSQWPQTLPKRLHAFVQSSLNQLHVFALRSGLLLTDEDHKSPLRPYGLAPTGSPIHMQLIAITLLVASLFPISMVLSDTIVDIAATSFATHAPPTARSSTT